MQSGPGDTFRIGIVNRMKEGEIKMKKIRKYFEKINYNTLLKYFLSYFLLLSFLLLCFFWAFRVQLENIYAKERDKALGEKLELFEDSFNSDLNHVFNIHYNLCNNANLKMLGFSPDFAWYKSQSIADMRAFNNANPLLDDIIYIDKYGGNILACENYVYGSEGEYYFKIKEVSLKIPLGEYGHEGYNSVVYCKKQNVSLLLLFPRIESRRYELLYVLDADEIISKLNNTVTEEISAVCLTDGNGHIVASAGEGEMPQISKESNFLEIERREEEKNIIYTVPLHANLFLTVSFDKEILVNYADQAFFHMYLIMAGIGGAGLLLILFGMKMTYAPLYRLGKKFVNSEKGKGLESQLDVLLSTTLEEQKKLQKKINKYHMMMKESVLDTIVSKNGEEITQENMEKIFSGEPGSLMVVVKIRKMESEKVVGDGFQEAFRETFSQGESLCIRLDQMKEDAIYFIYYGGMDQDKYNVLKYFLNDYHQITGCKIAMSDSTSAPLSIPNVYMNALQAAKSWNHRPVNFYDELEKQEETVDYWVYKELNAFSTLLHQMKFEEAKKNMWQFLKKLEQAEFPDFYIRSVLIEMLTGIITDMNQQGIRFAAYNNIYFESLYYIRSFPYKQKEMEIYEHFLQLITTYENEINNLTIKSSQIQEFVDASYTSSEFSIGLMAEKFHVSIAYMSYLFKKYFNENFSEYLWSLRVERAKKLLKETSQPIEEICVEVGYENVSSFRRKFKKELGMTPSQYREQEKMRREEQA